MRLFLSSVLLCATFAYAQDFRWNGYPKPASGVVVVTVDNHGKVTAAKVAQSTGDPRLDAMALNTFKRWKFKPGTASRVRIPVTFAPPGVKY